MQEITASRARKALSGGILAAMRRTWIPLLLLLLPLAAQAHTGAGNTAGGFLAGFLHPISGLDHVLAMLAVGMWGAQLGNPALWVLPVAFPIVMAFGGIAGIVGLPLPQVEVGVTLSVIVLGAMIALDRRPPLVVAGLMVAFFAIFHGYAHGVELPHQAGALAYSAGFVLATGMLHITGIGIGFVSELPRGLHVARRRRGHLCGRLVSRLASGAALSHAALRSGTRPVRVASAAALLLAASPAWAHGTSNLGDFYSGLAQPVFHLVSLLLLLTLGLSAAQMPEGQRLEMPLAFSVGTLAGAFAGLAGVAVPGTEGVVQGGTLCLGILVAARWRLPLPAALLAGGLLGLAQGHFGTFGDRETVGRPLLYALGQGLAPVLLASWFVALADRFQAAWLQIAIRVAGSWIATIALLA